jgi:rare lipoprotein A
VTPRLIVPALLLSIVVLASGCGHKTKTASAPPPPPISRRPSKPPQPAPIPTQTVTASSEDDADFVAKHTPIYTEVGSASWYGPPYHNRRGANGQVFDQNALAAAHRTLPMNSLIRVTNLGTGQSAIMRVTDRGPFVTDRVIALSMASAKAVGVWRPGTAQVRIEVFDVPHPIEEGGRWCVQIGAFSHADEALKLRDHLQSKYHSAQVIEFTGPTGHWVRIRPFNDDKERAVTISRELKPAEGNAYLVRLD